MKNSSCLLTLNENLGFGLVGVRGALVRSRIGNFAVFNDELTLSAILGDMDPVITHPVMLMQFFILHTA